MLTSAGRELYFRHSLRENFYLEIIIHRYSVICRFNFYGCRTDFESGNAPAHIIYQNAIAVRRKNVCCKRICDNASVLKLTICQKTHTVAHQQSFRLRIAGRFGNRFVRNGYIYRFDVRLATNLCGYGKLSCSVFNGSDFSAKLPAGFIHSITVFKIAYLGICHGVSGSRRCDCVVRILRCRSRVCIKINFISVKLFICAVCHFNACSKINLRILRQSYLFTL